MQKSNEVARSMAQLMKVAQFQAIQHEYFGILQSDHLDMWSGHLPQALDSEIQMHDIKSTTLHIW